MPVSLDPEAADAAVAVQLVDVAAIPAQRQIDVSTAHDGRAAIGVDQRDRAIVADRKAGDRAALRIGCVTELAVLGDDRPTRRALMREHRAARRREGTVTADHIRRGAARGLGNEQLIAMTEREAERRPAR